MPSPPRVAGSQRYVLVPGAVEPRQNYALALTAFGLFRQRYPDSTLKLVWGAPAETNVAPVSQAAKRMGLAGQVGIVQTDSRAELRALVAGCSALLVPSLYETVGQSVLQAMADGRPVLCSDIPELAELTGGSALAFDPRRPLALLGAFERLEYQPGAAQRSSEGGLERIARLPAPAQVADAYITILREARCQASSR